MKINWHSVQYSLQKQLETDKDVNGKRSGSSKGKTPDEMNTWLFKVKDIEGKLLLSWQPNKIPLDSNQYCSQLWKINFDHRMSGSA